MWLSLPSRDVFWSLGVILKPHITGYVSSEHNRKGEIACSSTHNCSDILGSYCFCNGITVLRTVWLYSVTVQDDQSQEESERFSRDSFFHKLQADQFLSSLSFRGWFSLAHRCINVCIVTWPSSAFSCVPLGRLLVILSGLEMNLRLCLQLHL